MQDISTHENVHLISYPVFSPASPIQHLWNKILHLYWNCCMYCMYWTTMLLVDLTSAFFFIFNVCSGVNYIYTNTLKVKATVIDAPSVTAPCTLITPHVYWPGIHHSSVCPHFKNPLTKLCSEAGHLLYWLHWKSDLLCCTACQLLTSCYWNSGIDLSPMPSKIHCHVWITFICT